MNSKLMDVQQGSKVPRRQQGGSVGRCCECFGTVRRSRWWGWVPPQCPSATMSTVPMQPLDGTCTVFVSAEQHMIALPLRRIQPPACKNGMDRARTCDRDSASVCVRNSTHCDRSSNVVYRNGVGCPNPQQEKSWTTCHWKSQWPTQHTEHRVAVQGSLSGKESRLSRMALHGDCMLEHTICECSGGRQDYACTRPRAHDDIAVCAQPCGGHTQPSRRLTSIQRRA